MKNEGLNERDCFEKIVVILVIIIVFGSLCLKYYFWVFNNVVFLCLEYYDIVFFILFYIVL